MHILDMGPRVMQHNVAGGWMGTAGEQPHVISAAATSTLTTVHGDKLDGHLDIVNRRRLKIPQRFGGWIFLLLHVEVEREQLVWWDRFRELVSIPLKISCSTSKRRQIQHPKPLHFLGLGNGQRQKFHSRLGYTSASSEKLIVSQLVERTASLLRN